jgi:predicted AlkP superfamily phosphohydrolase/phosphomutase
MSGKPQLLIVGIDGMPHRLLEHWMAAGHLPHLSAFAERSTWSPMRCTWPPHTATGWPSLFNGRLPGEHGLFQFWDCQDPTYRLRVMKREEARVASLWDVLADHGWELGLLNIPMSHPPGPWPGYQITWPLSPTLHYIQPPELARELRQAGGMTRPDIACMFDGSADYPQRALGYVRARTQAARHLIAHRPVDALAVVYTELDRVLHHYWHAMDPRHVLHDTDPRHRGVILQTCVEIDRAFGEILELIDDRCTVMVASDHGFGPGYRNVRIHHLLADGGFCAFDAPGVDEDPVAADRELEISGELPQLKWSETRAYMPCPGSFGLNVNLKGRQRRGTVKAHERKALERELSEYLLELRDRDGKRPLFSHVVPAERAYAGPFASQAPDLLLVPAAPSVSVLCDLNGPTWTVGGQTGLHRLEGVVMLSADGVSAGKAAAAKPIEAVAGELLDLIGIPGDEIPRRSQQDAADRLQEAGLPATAWSESLDPGLDQLVAGRASPQEDAEATAPEEAQGSDPSLLSEQAIRRRLQKMGYL